METRFVTIHFINGKSQKFEFLPKSDDMTVVSSRLQKMLDSRSIVMQCDDRLYIYPLANIESIEISPGLDAVPGFVVNMLREMD
jgi:hypothetical protein